MQLVEIILLFITEANRNSHVKTTKTDAPRLPQM